MHYSSEKRKLDCIIRPKKRNKKLNIRPENFIVNVKKHSRSVAEVSEMLERIALEQFKVWKNKDNRKPLLVTGVRQCGKTYLIKHFGEAEFEEMAYFNFDGNDGLKSVFDYDFDKRSSKI